MGRKWNPAFWGGMGAALALAALMVVLAAVDLGGIDKYDSLLCAGYPVTFFSTAAVVLAAFGQLRPFGRTGLPAAPRGRARMWGTAVLCAVFLWNVLSEGILNLNGKMADDVWEDITMAWVGFLLGALVVFLAGFAFAGDKKQDGENNA